jgi:predicted ATPase with chaperone activity
MNDRIQKYDLSSRSQANTLKVALTIANMECRTEIGIDDLREAVELNAPIFEKPNQFKRD